MKNVKTLYPIGKTIPIVDNEGWVDCEITGYINDPETNKVTAITATTENGANTIIYVKALKPDGTGM